MELSSGIAFEVSLNAAAGLCLRSLPQRHLTVYCADAQHWSSTVTDLKEQLRAPRLRASVGPAGAADDID